MYKKVLVGRLLISIIIGTLLVMLAPVFIGFFLPTAQHYNYHNPIPTPESTSENDLILFIQLARDISLSFEEKHPILFCIISAVSTFFYWVAVVFFTRFLNDIGYPLFLNKFGFSQSQNLINNK